MSLGAMFLHQEIFTCSLFMEAIKGKIIGLSLVGSSDIQTTAAATIAETEICKLPWEFSETGKWNVEKD